MKSLRAAAAVASALVLGACANNPSVSAVGACTVIQRPGYAALSVRSASIQSVNMLFEFPASRFLDVALTVPEPLREQNLSALYIESSERAAAPALQCVPTSKGLRACTVSGPALVQAGLAVVVVAGPGASDVAVVERVRNYWASLSPCSPSAT
jgi:hypothetical protein